MSLSNACFSPTWILWRIGLGLLVGYMSTIAATAQSGPIIPDDISPMRFAIVRSNVPGCEPTCPEWISAEGKIGSGSPARLRALLGHLDGRRLPIVLYSSGGDVDAALALGHLIREKKLDTMVARTVFAGCKPNEKKCNSGKDKFRVYSGVTQTEGALCSSACTAVLAGGIRRLANCEPCVGIHEVIMVRNSSKKLKGKTVVTTDIKPIPKSYERKLEKYFREMQSGFWIVSAMTKTPHNEIRYLLTYELLDLNLVNVFGRGDVLTSIDICKTAPIADNCRTIRNSEL